MVVYVHDVTDVKNAARDPTVKYFNMKLQSPTKSFRSVSYREDYHEKLMEAAKTKSPVKLTGIKRKINFYDNTKEDIEINNTTDIIDIHEVPFKYQSSESETFTIKDILENKKHKDVVSLHAYLTTGTRPTIPTRIKSTGTVVNKKELSANDETGVIKITLWGNRIGNVAHDGVYFIRNAMVI